MLETDNPETVKYVRSHTVRLHLNTGILPKIPLCKGPSPSNSEKGMDSVCCANCEIMRVRYYESDGFFIDDKYALTFIIEMINMNSKLLSGLTISTCDCMIVYYSPAKSFCESTIYKPFLLEQCELMRSMRLVDSGITKENVGNYLVCDSNGIPHIMPSQKLKKLSRIGDDEGVEFEDDKISITDEDAMFASGKWAHLFLYYCVLDHITGRHNTPRLL